MNSRERFIAACRRQPLNRPPVWVMRQAGRFLPEYRALKEKHSFVEMVRTPDLAAEVTLMPLRRFALDAAIIFSDILVIPEALGVPYAFRETGGIQMSARINTPEDIVALEPQGIPEKLAYVGQALALTRRELGTEKALLGFGGSPWTLATYLIEGGSSKNYSRAKQMLHESPDLFHPLLEKITEATEAYFDLQIDAGVDAIQIFDSWGGILSYDTFWEASAKYMARLVEHIGGRVPVIVYSKGAHNWSAALDRTGADVLGVDWTIPLTEFYDLFDGRRAVQGNLDPALMSTTPEIVQRNTLRILDEFGHRKGLIFNLGHGIHPAGKLDCMEALVETISTYRTINT